MKKRQVFFRISEVIVVLYFACRLALETSHSQQAETLCNRQTDYLHQVS